MIELEFNTFMDIYMPAGKHELPSAADLSIPDMNKAELLGHTENPVCEQLVRLDIHLTRDRCSSYASD